MKSFSMNVSNLLHKPGRAGAVNGRNSVMAAAPQGFGLFKTPEGQRSEVIRVKNVKMELRYFC
jgi:hypothetical protein